MYIKKIDELFDNMYYHKHYSYDQISYTNKDNITKRYNLYINKGNHTICKGVKDIIRTEIPLKNSNYYYSTYHKSLEDTYNYLYLIINN